MKKNLLVVLLVVLGGIFVNASAQLYIGGSLGVGLDTSDHKL